MKRSSSSSVSVRPQSSRTTAPSGPGRPPAAAAAARVVSAPRRELGGEIWRPVRLVHLEAVAEDREWQAAGKRRQQPCPDLLEIAGQRGAVVVAQHVAFAAHRRPLHHHPGAARDEEPHLPRLRRRRQASPRRPRRATAAAASPPRSKGPHRARQTRQSSLPRRHCGPDDARRAGSDHALEPQPAGRVHDADGRSAKRPSAAQREVEPQAQRPARWSRCRAGPGTGRRESAC